VWQPENSIITLINRFKNHGFSVKLPLKVIAPLYTRVFKLIYTPNRSGGSGASRREIVMSGMRNQKLGTGRLITVSLRGVLFLLFLITAAVVPVGDQVAVAQELFVDPPVSTPTDFFFTVDIDIDCAGQAVKGVEAILAFDPFLLQLTAITPGPWYTGTGLDYYFFDYTPLDPAGTIHFASSVLDGTNDQSLTIATCHFTALGFGSTPVIFQEVDVRGPTNLDLGFGHSTGDLIIIDPAVPITHSSFGALKALYR
jgi:hypothetical protein